MIINNQQKCSKLKGHTQCSQEAQKIILTKIAAFQWKSKLSIVSEPHLFGERIM